jgi:hypothetical protein
MKYTKLISKFDFTTTKPFFYFNGERRLSSIFGGILHFLFMCCIGIIILIYIKSYLNENSYKIFHNEVYNFTDDSLKVDLSTLQLNFGMISSTSNLQIQEFSKNNFIVKIFIKNNKADHNNEKNVLISFNSCNPDNKVEGSFCFDKSINENKLLLQLDSSLYIQIFDTSKIMETLCNSQIEKNKIFIEYDNFFLNAANNFNSMINYRNKNSFLISNCLTKLIKYKIDYYSIMTNDKINLINEYEDLYTNINKDNSLKINKFNNGYHINDPEENVDYINSDTNLIFQIEFSLSGKDKQVIRVRKSLSILITEIWVMIQIIKYIFGILLSFKINFSFENYLYNKLKQNGKIEIKTEGDKSSESKSSESSMSINSPNRKKNEEYKGFDNNKFQSKFIVNRNLNKKMDLIKPVTLQSSTNILTTTGQYKSPIQPLLLKLKDGNPHSLSLADQRRSTNNLTENANVELKHNRIVDQHKTCLSFLKKNKPDQLPKNLISLSNKYNI